jgi:hypothetical protein
MEWQNLFSKFGSSEEKKEYFLALEIGAKYVWVAAWQVEEEIKIVSLGSRERWDGKTLPSLTAGCDASLASALEKIPEEPSKVVFGLPETWVSGNQIVGPRKVDLKALCQKLDLKPLGFVVTTEAIIEYLKIVEGTPVSAILVHVDKEEVLLSLIKAGKRIGSQVIGKSESLGDDIYEGMARFGKEEAFPSRILLYGDDLENARQTLLSYDWKESLFLHIPKVEVLEGAISIKAVAVAGGGEVAESLGLKRAVKAVSAKDLGFIQDKDVMEVKEEKVGTTVKEPGEDKVKEQKKKFVLPKLKLPKISLKIPSFKITAKLPKIPLKNRLAIILAGVGLFLFVLGGVAMAFYWYFPKAQVTIYVQPKNLEKELEINVDPDLTILDFEKKQIPGEVFEVTVEKVEEGLTSGEKLVGDRAKGEVTVHNFTSGSKSFSKGTKIIGPNDKEFTLDVDISVASSSAVLDENWNEITVPGKTKVAVTAAEIGPDYNLAADSEFTVKGFASSSYRAKNEKAFSGGTSRKVKVVSAEDQEALLTGVKSELENEIKEELEKMAPEDKEILKEGILMSFVNQEFDKAVGAEADKLKLELEMQAKTLAFSPQDLQDLLERAVADSIPEGFVLKKIETEKMEGKIQEEGKAVVKVQLKARLVPDLDLQEIKKNLVGKYPSIGREYLESLPNFNKAEIMITPNLPARLRVFPRFAKSIDIKIEIQE